MFREKALGYCREAAERQRDDHNDGELPDGSTGRARRQDPRWNQETSQCGVEGDALRHRWHDVSAVAAAVGCLAALHTPPADCCENRKQCHGRGENEAGIHSKQQRTSPGALESRAGDDSRRIESARNPREFSQVSRENVRGECLDASRPEERCPYDPRPDEKP